MTEIDDIFDLLDSVKGWPVEEANTLKQASEKIFGSPFWKIPEDRYIVLDNNETYSLLAVFADGRISSKKRYMVVNIDFLEKSQKVT
jgi:hypothetical protein